MISTTGDPDLSPAKPIRGNKTDVKEAKPKLEVQVSRDEIIKELTCSNEEEVYNFPPNISSLNINGRPRFDMVTVRENGRLKLFMEPNTSPQLVRSPVRQNGRLQMWLLIDDQRLGGRE